MTRGDRQPSPQRRADALCALLNGTFGWPGAEAEITRESGYTGRIILDARASAEVIIARSEATRLREAGASMDRIGVRSSSVLDLGSSHDG